MGLTEYNKKRKFSETPEPEGAEVKSRGALRFVVQEHHASHLHYDFRLELDGVLKSWAVPKGPSLNPRDRRLAVQVEDHPLAYRTFAGTIPEGHYGAGEVFIWDSGTYTPAGGGGSRKEQEAQLLRELEGGKMKIELKGEKLNGTFNLFLTGGKNWMLIKAKDEHAKEEGSKPPAASRKVAGSKRGKPEAGSPPLAKPMLATLVDAPFDDPDWLFEIKWDGYRTLAHCRDGKVELVSRNGKPFTERYGAVRTALEAWGRTAVLDGEIVAVDKEGVASFQLLQNVMNDPSLSLHFYVFDLLELDGEDLKSLSLQERKARLKKALPAGHPVLRYSDHVAGAGKRFFDAAIEKGLEGIIGKRASSTYQLDSRTPDWVKIKVAKRQEVVIAGFTEPRATRTHFGALLLGVYEGDELVYVGHSGSGFNKASLADLHKKLSKLKVKKSPFARPPKTNMPATWVKPELVCEIKFTEWTREGLARHPIFQGLRTDKQPGEVRRETEQPTEQVVSHPVEVTNPEKVYWKKEAFTKGDMVQYYRDVAPFMLPYLLHRPHSLHRHPNGIDAPGFYQKDVRGKVPGWISRHTDFAESTGKEVDYLVVRDEAALIYMANLGCIEINPWHAKAESWQRPDWCLIDLDPDVTNSYDEVVLTAQTVRQVLDSFKVPSFPKTSGSTGMHIYIPLGGAYDFEASKNFAERVVNLVEEALPELTSTARSPAKRKGKIYLDFLQNKETQTAAAPYSLRPKPGMPVSAPLDWSEVKKGLKPGKFTALTILQRLKREGDLFKGVLGPGAKLP